MTPAEAKRAARRYVVGVVRAQGSDDAVASFLDLPLWVGEDRHPDVDQVAAAVDVVLNELRFEETDRG